MRMDKYLWAVRLFKTRALANEALTKGRVTLNGLPCKPAHEVALNEVFTLRRAPVLYTYRVKGIPQNRVSAKLVAEYLEDKTSPAEIQKLTGRGPTLNLWREPGTGRPTKKERRELDALRASFFDEENEPTDAEDNALPDE